MCYLRFYQLFVGFFFLFLLVIFALAGINNLSGFPTSTATPYVLAGLIGIFQAVFHVALGGHRSSWRYFSFEDGKKAIFSTTGSVVLTSVILYSTIPATGWVIVLCAAISGVLAPRLLSRIACSHDLPSRFRRRHVEPIVTTGGTKPSRKLLLVGFGDHAADFIRFQSRAGGDYEIIGVVHINAQCEAASLRGVPIVGSIDSLGSIIRRFSSQEIRPDCLVLTRDEMSSRSVSEVLSATEKFDIPVAWLPRADQLSSNLSEELQPIELDDLLPRSADMFDSQRCRKLMCGSTVLVTGAGGSIGSELARQIGSLAPDTLILTDASEHALYMIDQEVSRVFPELRIVSKLLDVRDRDAVFRAMNFHRPHYVFHAAALKHVPIVESQACEGVMTNVVGSRNVADAAAESKVKSMVMVSTDKAVNPANVMGATKRLAEVYCQAMDASNADVKGETRYVTVRFGNVLGSNGSVVPLFQKQLVHGGPLTVTHPDVERFFMTIPEASRLILQALMLASNNQNDESGIFVLEMGVPVKIVDLARQVIRLSGFPPGRDVKIVFTGLRPGEKLFEELIHEAEELVPTEHPNLMVARPRFAQVEAVRNQIDVIQTAAKSGDSDEVLRLLRHYIPEFEITARAAQSISEKGATALLPEAV